MRPLEIGVVCYPTFGGSGVIATEVGLGMARRGHRVHVFAYERPARLDGYSDHIDLGPGTLTFHRVEVRDYPVFHQPPYALALSSRIVDLATHGGLDLLHVHYAVPHATSAYLARQVLRRTCGTRAPNIVTTLHGTDITLVGSDPSYRPITRFSILESDAVTVPSAYLERETRTRFDLPDLPVEVIPNFVDTERFTPGVVRTGPRRIVHVSNLRAVKRVLDVVDIFAGLRRASSEPLELVIVGDGPERTPAEARARELGLGREVVFLGHHHEVAEVLQTASMFLLPSALESFGVAALEAMSCGVPVLASDTGGLPEVVLHGETGFLAPVGDVATFVARGLELLADPSRAAAMGEHGRRLAVERFGMEAALDRYEALYARHLPTP